MAGAEVNKQVIDTRTAEAVLKLRDAFDKVENVAKWLEANPDPVTIPDILESQFGYTEAEAYNIRYVFQQLELIRTTNATLFDTARALSGMD